MINLQGKKIVLTGASRGIGECLAYELAAQGAHLILVARNEAMLQALSEKLKKVAPACDYIPCDLSKPEQTDQLIDRLKNNYSQLDGVIHNAGIGLYGEFESTKEEDIRELFEINFFSILRLTQGVLPLLKLGADPTLLFVSSLIGWRAIPRVGTYCGSKAAINLFADALRTEMEKYSIRVVVGYPGRTKTQFSEKAKAVGWRPFPTEQGMSAEAVAKKLVRAYRKGKRDEFVCLSNRFLIWMNFFFPRLIDWGLEKYFKKRQVTSDQ